MIFTGKITGAHTYEVMSDTITLTGTLCGRPCTINVQCDGVAEILVGQYGFKKDEAVVELRGVTE